MADRIYLKITASARLLEPIPPISPGPARLRLVTGRGRTLSPWTSGRCGRAGHCGSSCRLPSRTWFGWRRRDGSCSSVRVARGDEGPDSDLDLLVVVDQIDLADRTRLISSIRRAISARVPIDVFVTDLSEYERRKDVIGSMAYWPAREGEVVYERPS